MEIIKSAPIPKDRAAKLCGLEIYDFAIPQPWIDEITLKLIAKHPDSKIDFYWQILSGTVWCYDQSLMGYPYALTTTAYQLLTLPGIDSGIMDQRTVIDIVK
jgi:hypothetical protein